MAAVKSKGSIFITGANGGLGSAIVVQVASSPELSAYHGLYTVRDATSKYAALTSALRTPGALPSHRYDVLSLDLTKLDNVRRVAEELNARISAGEIPPIRALILNAGFMDFGKQAWTEDGVDVVFASNYLGHWLLVLLLLKSMDKEAGRIIVIGSQSHDPLDKRNDSSGAFAEERHKTVFNNEADFEAIAKGAWSPASPNDSFMASMQGGFRRYGAAKLFSIMMLYELQRRIDRDPTLANICVMGVDPGTMVTGQTRRAGWFIRVFLFQFVYALIAYLNPKGPVRPTRRSASDVLEAAFGTCAGTPLKGLYLDGRRTFESSAESRDAAKQKLVWRETAKIVGLKAGDTVLSDWQ